MRNCSTCRKELAYELKFDKDCGSVLVEDAAAPPASPLAPRQPPTPSSDRSQPATPASQPVPTPYQAPAPAAPQFASMARRFLAHVIDIFCLALMFVNVGNAASYSP
jgi:hypothetical protein